MFSVPGWNISTSIATQVEKPKVHDPSKEGKKSKKRKQKQEAQIDGDNVGEYWEKIVEGKNVKKPGKSSAAKDGAEVAGEGAQEKAGRKRKRKGDKATDDTAEGSEKPAIEPKDTEAGAEASIGDSSAPKDTESKREKKKRKKDKKDDKSEQEPQTATNELSTATAPVSLLPPEPAGLTPLQKSMRLKLAGARFRHLNEALYTKPSAESLTIFKEDPSMFEDYHRGFAQQVEVWPENPVDNYVDTILARGKARAKDPRKDKRRKDKKGKSDANEEVESASTSGDSKVVKPLPRNFKGHSTIADLGCGTASLSYRLQPHLKPLNITLNSFDLSKPSGPSAPLVTVADISSLPLPDSSVDVAIFCLALMGTNWLDFIDEAHRILRWRGELWISEIKSRFGRVEKGKKGQPPVNSVGSLRKVDKKPKGKKKADKPEDAGIQGSDDETELAEAVDGQDAKEGTDVSSFVSVLLKHGFVLDALPERQSDAIDLSNKMFVKMQFVKGAQPTRGKNAKKEGDAGAAKLRMGIKGKKFIAVADEGGNDEADGKTLKPCLYKIR
ncbi:hypothetical protein P280DRAFT_107564 [Massarina eburnea CBS 473.64]|uniref:Ribosomal RNA-processing protein 8 n=1 Tax=Massarina eburnea CBS 473.64 TaxID=1395130 RepID=A0A6A6RU03_9PLEO|nr:hypothetical protein P280DRAFT_107564 [Massarina eburnea CBS 473.64]